jgi:hypothetical protein
VQATPPPPPCTFYVFHLCRGSFPSGGHCQLLWVHLRLQHAACSDALRRGLGNKLNWCRVASISAGDIGGQGFISVRFHLNFTFTRCDPASIRAFNQALGLPPRGRAVVYFIGQRANHTVSSSEPFCIGLQANHSVSVYERTILYRSTSEPFCIGLRANHTLSVYERTGIDQPLWRDLDLARA